MRTRSYGLLALAAMTVGACGTGEGSVGTNTVRFELAKAADCGDLLTRLRADAKAKVNATAESYMKQHPFDAYGYGSAANAGGGAGGATSGGGGAAGGAGAPQGHSETNTQVGGVDEADIVKTDGEHLYVLHGEELYVVDSWPPQSIAVEKSIGIEGMPYEMFVDGGKAIVFSRVALEEPESPVVGVGGGSNSGAGAPGGAGGGAGSSSSPPMSPHYYGAFTKITVIDVAAAAPAVLRESYVEGQYQSSRRHGDVVRAVVSGGFYAPQAVYDQSFLYDDYGQYGQPYYGTGSLPKFDKIKWITAIEGWRQKALAAIDATPLSAWIPATAEKKFGQITWSAPACQNYYVPGPGVSEEGVTQVVSLDLAHLDAPLGGAAILGSASEVYANHGVMLLAQPRWSTWDPMGLPKDETVLHHFDLTESGVSYAASGKIAGHPHDQFSIDESDGIVRVSTTERRPDGKGEWSTTTVNRVLTLSPVAGQLKVLGDTGPLAEGETIFSTRFVGNRAYVVTFRQVDPLFVIDMTLPSAPKVLGALKIPGFSDYMHPLDAGHLLTIGRDTQENASGGVSDNGLMLQIFDVQNPTQPKLTHKHVFAEGGYSDANSNHKAFTFWAEKGLLAFPYLGWDSNYTNYKSSLELFRVDAQSGFQQIGSVDHTALTSTLCESEPYGCSGYGYGYAPVEVRRGVFIDDFVYSVSYGGVLVHATSDLSAPVATLPLPAPKGYVGYYY